MALEVVTDGKNDKTEKNDYEYLHNKRTRDGTCVFVLCAAFFCANKYILSCVIIRADSPLNESNETENYTVVVDIFIVSFPLFSRLCNQSRENLKLLAFIFGGPQKKTKRKEKKFSSTGKRPTT